MSYQFKILLLNTYILYIYTCTYVYMYICILQLGCYLVAVSQLHQCGYKLHRCCQSTSLVKLSVTWFLLLSCTSVAKLLASCCKLAAKKFICCYPTNLLWLSVAWLLLPNCTSLAICYLVAPFRLYSVSGDSSHDHVLAVRDQSAKVTRSQISSMSVTKVTRSQILKGLPHN